MNFDFTKTMQDASDADLVRILTTDRGDYQDEAIRAAEKEFESRSLPSEQIESVKKVNSAQLAAKQLAANAPLDAHWKIIAVLFPGIFQFIISGFLESKGFDRKARELSKWTIIGIVFYFVIGIIINYSDL